jgi:hypothetical protein
MRTLTTSLSVVTALFLCGCGGESPPDTPDTMAPPVQMDPREAPPGPPQPEALPEVTCAGTPTVGPKERWRHTAASPLIVALGDPKHRGVDLITSSTAAVQHVRGEISYGGVDKALEDEDVELFACRAGAWEALGRARTDGDGRFDLVLSGTARLPIGQRPLYGSVAGDRSAVAFLALVLPTGSAVAVSDIDGTLTASENAYPESLLTGKMVAAHDGAAEALAALKARRYYPVYLTSRGRVFTEPSRAWLKDRGFPLGPVRLAPALLTIPGGPTVDYKANTMGEFTSVGLRVGVGVGNRASDAEAYGRVGVPARQTFLKGPEYKDETEPVVARGAAVPFESYRMIVTVFQGLPLAL